MNDDSNEEYRQRIVRHLKEREQRAQELEHRMAQLAHRLKEFGVQRLASAGDVPRLKEGELYRKGLQNERESLEKELQESRAEVQRARERLEMVDNE